MQPITVLTGAQVLITRMMLQAHHEIDTQETAVALCPECKSLIFASTEHGIAICGYCGAGPHQIETGRVTPSEAAKQAAKQWAERNRNARDPLLRAAANYVQERWGDEPASVRQLAAKDERAAQHWEETPER